MIMAPGAYLRRTATLAVLPEAENESIRRSMLHMRRLLFREFRREIKEPIPFGSFTRKTILPRYMDSLSDVDYMVVFADNSLRPQTYLDRLRRFVENNYSRSQIQQSHPTIQLELNHIRFELVPAIHTLWSGHQIPAKASDYEDWIATDPKGFNRTLMIANNRNNNLIKPLVRVVKYWNARMGYPFESYELEQRVVGHDFSFVERNIYGYFCDFMNNLDADWFAPQWKKDQVDRAHRAIEQMQSSSRQRDIRQATDSLKRIIPEVVR